MHDESRCATVTQPVETTTPPPADANLTYSRVVVKLSGEALCGEKGGFGINPETLHELAAELARFPPGGMRRPDALAIIARMRYLKDQAAQGRAAKVRPVWEGAAGTKESETIETKPADRTSPQALQQDIARAQALPKRERES